MKRPVILWISSWCLLSGSALAQSFPEAVTPLVKASCIGCHDGDTKTGLNLGDISHDLSDTRTFRRWEKVFDRVRNGEMPPESEDRPDPGQRKTALASLETGLRAASLARQKQVGRVPTRRLTKLEYGYTIRDLLLIEDDVTADIPGESNSGSFDTVGSTQRISAVHMQSYLKAADAALQASFNLNRRPFRSRQLDFLNNAFLNEFHDKPLNLGGSVSRKLPDGVAVYRDVDYLLRSDILGFAVPAAGTYRITSQVEAFQSPKPITFKLIRRDPTGGASLLKSFDLLPGKPESIVVETYLKPGDAFYSTFECEVEPFALLAVTGPKKYKGPGLAIKGQKIEGPLSKSWPPPSTRSLLKGVELKQLPVPNGVAAFFRNLNPNAPSRPGYSIKLNKPPIEHVAQIARELAPRAFRRPPADGELESFVDLARPAIQDGRPFLSALRVTLRAMLSSPQFMIFAGKPGRLNDYALANRLSYFLWKSMPDAELFALAGKNRLSDPEVLAGQVDRMLDDKKAARFITDFLGQWLRLYQVDATSPDEKLYPEYDELLGNAVRREPGLFFTELVRENLSLTNLVDSEFAFLNRRLAEHYRIPGVAGQHFRKVTLPKNSPRGGMLTQAAILKTTANGTVTSPVTRGNFVLTSILGTPPSPPPPTVGSIEPDTRGKTTIRQILAAHRDNETCNKCHREIDPPGFALESFDPIGGFRTKYRANKSSQVGFFGFLNANSYTTGPAVDASGVTADGKKFSGIREFKTLLLADKEQIARHFVSQLVVYSTGGEIQFADRDSIEAILDRTRKSDFPVRTIIHEVVQSPLFRNK